jgi:hypothetical protein
MLSRKNCQDMMVFLIKTTVFLALVVLWGPNYACSTPFTMEQSIIGAQSQKKKNKRVKKFKKISILKKFKKSYEKDGSAAVFVLGMLFSVTSLILLFIGGAGAVLFGLFGALLCFLAWRQSDDKVPLFLVGVGLGFVGAVLGFWQLMNSRD